MSCVAGDNVSRSITSGMSNAKLKMKIEAGLVINRKLHAPKITSMRGALNNF